MRAVAPCTSVASVNGMGSLDEEVMEEPSVTFTRGETEQIPAVFHCVTNCISVGQFCQSIFWAYASTGFLIHS